jgi:hypothetical protein
VLELLHVGAVEVEFLEVEDREVSGDCEAFAPYTFVRGVAQGHQDVEDGQRGRQLVEGDGVSGDEQNEHLLHFGLVLEPSESGEGFDVPKEGDDFSVHLLVVEAEVDHVLDEGEEEEGGAEAVCFGQLPQQSEDDLIGEHRQMLVFEDLAGLHHFLAERGMLLIEVVGDLAQFLTEDTVVAHHCYISNIITTH